MRRVTPFIPSSLETCTPPLEGAYVCAPTNHVAHGRARPVRASNGGRTHMRPSTGHALLLWSPLSRGRPYAHVRPFIVCALDCGRPRPCTPHEAFASPRLHPMRHSHPPFAPPEAFAPSLRAPQDVRAHGSRSCPTACAPLEYKFIKIIVHSTTWASRPSTTMRWMIAGCLGGDHSFLIHSHGPRAHPWTRLYACLI
jgi:hypothetical protein